MANSSPSSVTIRQSSLHQFISRKRERPTDHEESDADDLELEAGSQESVADIVAEGVGISCKDLGILSATGISDQQKYDILTNAAPIQKVYPPNSQKRRFQAKWVDNYHWIRYSVSLDSIFCAPCFVFNNNPHITEFVKSPFRDWKNAVGSSRGALKRHSLSNNHQLCVERALSFIAVVEKREKSVKSQLSKSYDKQAEQNTRALTAIVDVIKLLIEQGLAFRGHSWDKVDKMETGNFTKMVEFLSHYCPELASHIDTCAKNARYLSPKIQNEFINLIGEIIRQNIIEECNSSPFWSIMVDEATDTSTKEQVSIYVRYVSANEKEIDICEEFLGFVTVPTTDAGTITSAIVDFSSKCGLNMFKLVGKGFDGAANMSGHVSGVSSSIFWIFG